MRIVVIAVLLGTGVPGFCQSAGTAPPSFENEKKDPPTVVPPQTEIGKEPPVCHITLDGLLKMNVPPGIGRVRMPSPPADSAMIVHPPQASMGVQPPGTAVAQNLYPGLELMPIGQLKAKVEPIPITFPIMKLEKIPTIWAQYTILPVQSGKADTASK
jgi:hypothetical protein